MAPSNVVLITIDSLRHDYADLLDVDSELFSQVQRALGNHVKFTTAVSNGPNTPSSFPSILTSTYSIMYGGYHYLDEQRPFVAEVTRQAGFDTVAYHSNPHLGRKQNYNKGFDIFNDSAEGSDSLASLKDGLESRLDPDSMIYGILRRIWHYFTFSTDTSAYAKAPTITENAVDWLDEKWNGRNPFFMWLHYMDVHYPFAPPKRFLESIDVTPLPKRRVVELNGKMHENSEDLSDEDIEDLIKLYVGEIRFVDHYIGRVLEELDTRGILDETIVVITADHGEAFGEHGRFGHHPYLYDELLRVPLLIHVPGVESRTIDQQVSLLDLGPTLYDLLGVETPKTVQGASFAPLLDGDTMEEKVAISTGMGGGTLACRTSEWKCFWQVEEDTVELYDLQSDPEELDDVSEDNPNVIEEFQDMMQTYLDEAEATDIDLPKVEQSAEVNQRLRDLGYVD